MVIGPDRHDVFYFRRAGGEVVREAEASPEEINARRDALLGSTFRFTWPDIPKGARRL